MAKDIYGNSNDTPVVKEFGSFVMDLFSTTSDLDLSVNFRTKAPLSREQKIKTLKKFAKKLYYIQDLESTHSSSMYCHFQGKFYEVLFPAKWTPCLFNNNVKLLPCLLYLAKMLQLQTGHVATATADFLYLIFYFLSNF
ncbi:hypothetical protein ACS0TY_005604 [Phlomoides rotata]